MGPGLTVVLVEAGVQQPVAMGVTRQEVHGAVVGSVALRTAYRSKPDYLSGRAALGPPRPEARVLGACVVRASSVCDVRARGPGSARARHAPNGQAPAAAGRKGRGRTERRGSCGGRWVPRRSHKQGRTDRTKDRVEKRPRQHSCPQHNLPEPSPRPDDTRLVPPEACVFQRTHFPLRQTQTIFPLSSRTFPTI